MKFLQQAANYLFNIHGDKLSDITIVFPNRRAGLFFQKYLSEISEKPVFSPRITTISELVSQLSGLDIADKNRLVIELYTVFVKNTGSNESLDDFYYWGEMMLSDFDDIDKYMVDARQLFSNIESLKEIDSGFDYLSTEQLAFLSTFWENVLKARDSRSKDYFIGIWKKLFSIYSQFQKQLSDKKLAYEGLMYRQMVEKLKNIPEISTLNNCAFIGFNALNKCEKALFKFMQTNYNALFFWDYDKYYLDSLRHEAALFMHENLLNFPLPADFSFSDNEFSSLSNIETVEIPGFSGQAAYAARWIEQNEQSLSKRFDNTAVVMCDETMLLHMINSMPASIEEFNITMGFPVKKSPAFSLVRALIEIDRNSRKTPDGNTVFYYRNVLGLLSNSLIKNIIGDYFDELSNSIRTENRIYLQASDFSENELLTQLFNLPENADECSEYLQTIIKMVFQNTPGNDKLLKESLYQLHLAITRLHDSIFDNANESAHAISKKLFYQLLLRQLDRLAIAFEGEPLSGLQLMGFLETRCLDFDNIVLLSFNDENMPGSPHNHSFIPYSLRKGFGLPVSEQRNAMYAYYFYRLIQRAKTVSLVYDSRTEGMSKGEISRFATQLKYEAGHIEITNKQAVFNFEPDTTNSIEVSKTDEVIKRIENYMQNKRVSPSALNTYLDCKLKFYFQYIENIREADDVQEDIDHLLFGRVAHVALEELYKPFVGKELSKTDIENIISDRKNFDTCLRKALEQEYFKKGKFNLNGRNILVFEIIKKYLLKILSYDKSVAPFTLISLENTYEKAIDLEYGEKNMRITYGGVVDRIDQVDEYIRVIDYKTGKSDKSVKSIEKLFADSSSRNKAAFQTLLYASCVEEKLKTNLPLLPAVYGARAVFLPDFDPFFVIDNGRMNYQANAAEFETHLKTLFAEILDSSVPFSQVADANQCKFCQFNGICNRL